MKQLISKHANGEIIYNLYEGGKSMPIAYHAETPECIVKVLESARQSRTRIKICLGDTLTGRDWQETLDVMGYIGLSKGREAYYPILVHNARSMGGGTIPDHCIVKIMESKGKRVLYQHPAYHM